MYNCNCCEIKEITHCLVKGSLPHGYEKVPICKECAEIIDNLPPHHWDNEKFVELIDLSNPSNNISWIKEMFNNFENN